MRKAMVFKGGAIATATVVAATLGFINHQSAALNNSTPETITLTGIIRDFPPESAHVDFTVEPSATPGARSAKNIQLTLDGEEKPVYVGGGKRINQEWRDGSGASRKISWCAPYCATPADNPGSFSANDNGGINSTSSYAQWFRDVPGVNMSRMWSITFNKVEGDSSLGVGEHYEYSTNNFHPIDEQLLGNGPDEHNFYFTYEIVCTFTYKELDNQFIWFKGDDDCWIFVDKKLAIDHGGIAANREQYFDLKRLNLVDKHDYTLHFFFAERKQPQSQFHIKTNIALQSITPGTVFAVYD